MQFVKESLGRLCIYWHWGNLLHPSLGHPLKKINIRSQKLVKWKVKAKITMKSQGKNIKERDETFFSSILYIYNSGPVFFFNFLVF